MRAMRIVVAVLAATFVVAVILLEVLALPLVARSARATVERCASIADLEAISVRRPAILGAVRGEVRDVRLRLEGLQLGALEVQTVEAHLPRVDLGWGTRQPDTVVTADVTVTEDALTAYLVAAGPGFADPELEVTPGGLRVGDTRVPFGLELAPRVIDGGIRLVPTAGDPRLWSSLGLELDLVVPDPIEVRSLTTGDGWVRLTARATVATGDDGEHLCPDLAGFDP